MQQAGIRLVCQGILLRLRVPAGVAVGVRKLYLAAVNVANQSVVIVHGLIHALDVHILGLRAGDFEIQSGRGPSLGNYAQQECQDARSQSWTPISSPPLLLVIAS